MMTRRDYKFGCACAFVIATFAGIVAVMLLFAVKVGLQ